MARPVRQDCDSRIGDTRIGDTRIGDTRIGDTRIGDRLIEADKHTNEFANKSVPFGVPHADTPAGEGPKPRIRKPPMVGMVPITVDHRKPAEAGHPAMAVARVVLYGVTGKHASYSGDVTEHAAAFGQHVVNCAAVETFE